MFISFSIGQSQDASPSFHQLRGSTPHEHLLNIIQFQKRDKTPYQNISFWET